MVVTPGIPSYTRTWRKTPYAAIAPSRPELSVKGKVVVVAGGGQGIGRAIALAFAQAEAAHIALFSRRTAPLDEAKSLITRQYPGTHVTSHSADVTDQGALTKLTKEIGPWDVLIVSAGMVNPLERPFDISMDEWWRTFEVNVKGTVMTIRSFFPTQKPDAKIIAITSNAFIFPSDMLRGTSAYNISKLAQAKAVEFLAAEYPDTFFGLVHPGLIETDLVRVAKTDDMEKLMQEGLLQFDPVELSANFVLWMASSEAAFLRARLVYAHFDVDELKAQSPRIQTSNDLMIGLNGLQIF